MRGFGICTPSWYRSLHGQHIVYEPRVAICPKLGNTVANRITARGLAVIGLKRAGFVAIDARYWLMRAPLTLIFTICFAAMLSVAGCMDTTSQDVEKAPADVIAATDATDTVVAKNAVVDEA